MYCLVFFLLKHYKNYNYMYNNNWCFDKAIQHVLNSIIWRPPNLNELTPYLISLGLSQLGSEASICL